MGIFLLRSHNSQFNSTATLVMEDNKEAVQDARDDGGGGGGAAGSGEEQNQHVENEELKDVEVDNLIKQKDGETSVGNWSPNPEHLSEVQAEAEDDKCQQELNGDPREVAENGHGEGEGEGEEEAEGRGKELALIAQDKTEEELNENGAIILMEELKNEPDSKTSSRSFLLDANDATGDESGTEEDQAAFMKELETFHRERSLDFKPPKFYQEPLNCLK